jgi:hypothetical protein
MSARGNSNGFRFFGTPPGDLAAGPLQPSRVSRSFPLWQGGRNSPIIGHRQLDDAEPVTV